MILRLHGGLKALGRHYVSINNPPHPLLVIQNDGLGPRNAPQISVSEFTATTDDALLSMAFELFRGRRGNMLFYPVYYWLNHTGEYSEAVWVDERGRVRHHPGIERRLVRLSRQWDWQLKKQGYCEAYRRALKEAENFANGPQAVPRPLRAESRSRLESR